MKPAASSKPSSVLSSSSSSVNGPSSISNSITSSTSPTINAPVANRSALFGGTATATTTPTIPPSTASNNNSSSNNVVGNGSVPSATKPVPNYGKPNLAPKPPGMQLAMAGEGGQSGGGNAATRPTVSRHQSMRSPRSPPVSQTAPNFPANHFGTMRGPPSSAAMFQSTDSIARPTRDAPGRPSGPPPKPPTMKPPPPPPVRSVSNTNLTHLPPSLSLAPSQDSSGPGTGSPATEPSSFGSVNNVSSLTLADELRAKMSANLSVASSSSNSISTGNLSVVGAGGTLTKGGSLKATAAPPLPPHRTSPAPPPPVPTAAAAAMLVSTRRSSLEPSS
ncbi:AGAP001886-PA-like protein [Anopheles sinensis]|uniref:AGAP001886-PA-like protein n=1 Tax=Anopheles sinensis TaxID=74873 RepID=A0A084VRW3_ANOSI|nr:AGAP001886-PA-like protein [Anopheles sinensis]